MPFDDDSPFADPRDTLRRVEADTCDEEQRETTTEFRAGIQTGLLEAALGCCWALFGGLILLAVAGIVFVAVYL